MKRSEVNKDPERARKRARSDLRCAVKKLGVDDALDIIDEIIMANREVEPIDPERAPTIPILPDREAS